MLRELPMKSMYEITHLFEKDSEENAELQRRGKSHVTVFLKKPHATSLRGFVCVDVRFPKRYAGAVLVGLPSASQS